ncbi:uncharacterized protein EV154DRAFT_425463, partial [Mucor mucedo]|uniref:uncharacterized protein n=1 Tax=Mucor mucedo TaxID=29922 RepID=UPI0022204120
LPPVLIEIQNVVNKAYMERLIKYCNYVCDEYNNIESTALTICNKNTWLEICNLFSDSHIAS